MKILIAKDEAFNFVYKANIEALENMGDVMYFSPIHDDRMPACDLLYLPGGYPELFAQELSDNLTMKLSIKKYAEEGGQIFAECGGFMYLCTCIDEYKMCDVLPLHATMEAARLHLGYRSMEINGVQIRGHEFHYSSIKQDSIPQTLHLLRTQTSAAGKNVDTEIFIYKNVKAGYTHWYWAETGFEKLWQAIR